LQFGGFSPAADFFGRKYFASCLNAADFFIRKYFASFNMKPFAHSHIYIYVYGTRQGRRLELVLQCCVLAAARVGQ
jgi:hypothetical protein